MPPILYLTPGVFDKGGISRYGRYQIRALRDLLGPTAVTVLSLAPPSESGFEVPFRVDFASFGANHRGRAMLVLAAATSVAAERPRLIWSAHVHLAPVAVALARLSGAQAVLNVYGAEVWTAVTAMRAAATRRVDHLISDCHATLQYVVDAGLHGSRGTSVHWDCVDLTQFSPGESETPSRYAVPPARGRMTVLTLARLGRDDTHKGIDRLIEVFSRLPRELPVRLIVAGDGDGRPRLQELVRSRGLEERVCFTGSVAEADLAAIYRSCDVFSLITHKGHGIGEGIPLTPLEAAACGKPILVGNQDGSREAAEDGVSGFVLEPFDLEAISDRITRLVKDRDLRLRMGRRARSRIEREHSFERFRQRLAVLLRELGMTPAHLS